MLKFDDGDPSLLAEEPPHDAAYWAELAVSQSQARAAAFLIDYAAPASAPVRSANVVCLADRRGVRVTAPVSAERTQAELARAYLARVSRMRVAPEAQVRLDALITELRALAVQA
jgi:hypothetical protein